MTEKRKMKAEDVLQSCLELLKQRGAEYDNSGNCFQETAALFNHLTENSSTMKHDVAFLMLCLKLARLKSNQRKPNPAVITDTIMDAINYLALYLEQLDYDIEINDPS